MYEMMILHACQLIHAIITNNVDGKQKLHALFIGTRAFT